MAYGVGMTSDDGLRRMLQDLRSAASTRVAAASASLGALMHEREGSNDDDEHDPEGVTLSSEWSRMTGLLDAAKQELQQVDAALARLDAGDYGVCADCGRPIPAERLEVRPFATHCVSCAAKAGR